MASRIVVVDDDVKLGELIQTFLEQRGYQVRTAGDGVAGYQLVCEERPNLVITDLLLPRMHGFELCKRIKKDPDLEHIPIILMTGVYKKTIYKVEGKRYGADDFLVKPFELRDLAASVEKLLPAEQAKPEEAPSEFEEKLEALSKAYRDKLPERLREIERAWEELAGARWDGAPLKDLHRQVHSLIGTAATFGVPGITDGARTLEHALSSIIDAGREPSAQEASHVRALLASLKRTAGRATAPSHAPKLHIQPAQPPIVRPASGSRLVHLVDADAAQAEDLARQLRLHDYKVRVFTDLDGIQDAVAQERPAAIIMEVVFPKGDLAGIRVAADLLHGTANRTPVIFHSVRGDLAARLEAVRVGGTAYFTKSADTSELLDKLDSLTEREEPLPYRVLIVEDDPQLAAHNSFTLQHAGMAISVVSDPPHLMASLAEFDPELILMDVYMPGCSGIELAAALRHKETDLSVPIVFLSTETNLDRQLAALSLGGDDFLTKPVEPSRLIALVTARAQRFRTLRSLMHDDRLTGLLTRAKIKEALASEIARATRTRSPLSFAAIDIDRFKTVNERHGHPTGDRLIKCLGRLLRDRVRRSDTIGRCGGDEFAVILPGADAASAASVINDVRSTFSLIGHQGPDGSAFTTTFSAGVADLRAGEGAIALRAAANGALAKAKQAGGDRVVLGELS